MTPAIDRKWLDSRNACAEGKEWYLAHCDPDPIIGVRQLLDGGHYEWANWLLVGIFTQVENVSYAVYAASQVLDVYEAQYPDDGRPRQAIAAARKYLRQPTAAAYAAAYAAARAARAADAAAAATAAAYAADTADTAATAYSAYAARAVRAAAACVDAQKKIQRRIILHGVRILRERDSHERF